jgi:D-sedoheptulose 7-phosphate isomerase
MNTTEIQTVIDEHIRLAAHCRDHLMPAIEKIADLLLRQFTAGGKVMLCGNGGSAADAQHLAAELVARFERERRALPALALTTDTSVLTAISNDSSFVDVFARQVEAFGRPGDVLIGISTSGNSKNVLAAVQRAKAIGCITIGFAGNDGGALARLSDQALIIPSQNTARIQEMHILVGHILCGLLEAAVASER